MNDDQTTTGAPVPPQANAQTSSGTPAQDNADYLQLKAELEQAQSKLAEMVVISQRALADLQNFRRRADEEKTRFVQYANAELMLDLLPALDNISRALAHEPKNEEWIKGVEQTLKQLTQVLEKRNLKAMSTVGQKFDPNLHEALMVSPGEKDVITQELEKGYLLGDKVLKRARVAVGNGEKLEG